MFKNFLQLYDYAMNYLGAKVCDISEKITPLAEEDGDNTHSLEVWIITEKIDVLFYHDINAEKELQKVVPANVWEESGKSDIPELLKLHEDEIFDNNVTNLKLFIP